MIYYNVTTIIPLYRYQHSRHLVQAINKFAKVNEDLPDNWERKMNEQGRVRLLYAFAGDTIIFQIFFIDHENCITTFIDPRLPMENEEPSTKTPPTSNLMSIPYINVRRVHSMSTDEVCW